MAAGPEAVVSAPARAVPASFGDRFGAHLIDVVVAVVLFGVFYGLSEIPGLPGWAEQVLAACAFLSLFGYQAVMTGVTHGFTVGKRVIGIRVEINDGRPIGFGRALLRDLVVKNVFQFFVLPWLISVLWVLRAPEHRALHDLIAVTRVVREDGRRRDVAQPDAWGEPAPDDELDKETRAALRRQGRWV